MSELGQPPIQLMRVTGTTPIDLSENASDFNYFLEKGYRVDQLFKEIRDWRLED